ncbi:MULTISPECIES: DUF4097 family beta strand repeat-containing protein [Streptococcus]|uniref:DUF4097 family beta strand repeat-containing protein n=1 Tax=Streptococcus TaxID=1301 RepID=UPI0015B9D98D|nr:MULTISPECIES: DUF4097 family beta strand repeat-containing protein [Streptococcus]MCP9016034.1 DUF4097 domain-containing protein [Streptococcus sp. CF8_St5-17]MDO6228735.1 DUF4097 family beta strand repeat-containing protein [Streptococcus infantis]QLF56289.1 DUF4097 family beta strand repeat protein [Streptococcus sp. oral taxon 061]
MRKLTKGFLIFGVVTSIIGFAMIIIGIQTDGVRSLLAMSQNPVFESRMEELVFDKDIENLNISLTEHSLVITESNDDKIHLQYHPTISEKENLQHSIKEKSLEITDTKSTTRRSIGSSIEGILFIASGISSRNDEIVLSLPRGKDLKNLTAQVDHRILSISNAKINNAKILSNGFLLRITDSEIKNSQLTTTGIVNVFETSLTDSRIQADHEHIEADDIQVHGRVEFEARKDISFELSQKELDRINVEFSAEHGDIYRWHRDRRDIPTGGSKGEALANPYKTEKKDTQDLLVAKSNQSIYFP